MIFARPRQSSSYTGNRQYTATILNLAPTGQSTVRQSGASFPKPAARESHGLTAARNFFNDDSPAAAAIDAAHGVQQEDQESPQGNELKTPFAQLIITGRGLMAACGDDAHRSSVDGHVDGAGVGPGARVVE